MSKFDHWSASTSEALGKPISFGIAVLIVVAWMVAGPILGFSAGWMLMINTITTIVTFLMVFMVHNSENHHAKAVQAKLDELISVSQAARNELIQAEDMTDSELDKVREPPKEST